MLEVMSRFDGRPVATEGGDIVYLFPSMLPTTKVVQQSGLVGMAQLLGGADRIHINQRMMMFEALSCGMWEQKNKYDI